MEENDLLDSLLSAAAEEFESESLPAPKPKETTRDNEDELFLGKISAFARGTGKISDFAKDTNSPTQKSKADSRSKAVLSLEGTSSLTGTLSSKDATVSGHKDSLKNSVVHSGDTDSSDDEENRDYQNAMYNEYGKQIKHLLADSSSNTSGGLSSSSFGISSSSGGFNSSSVGLTSSSSGLNSSSGGLTSSSTGLSSPSGGLSTSSGGYNSPKTGFSSRNNSFTSWKRNVSATDSRELSISTVGDKTELPKADVYTDPIFHIRIVKPLISGATFKEMMLGREAVFLSRIKMYVKTITPEKNWVIAGVLIRKTNPKTSAKGNQFSVWTLSDLHGDIKTVALFLFGNAHKDLWKVTQGTVVGVLNPSVLEDKSSSSTDQATLSIDNPQRVMVLGQSKDFGQCKSTNKSGDKCTAIVNLGKCEFCIFHIRKEYQKHSSGRSELQSNYAGRGLTALRNKVLGKNEVFYAGKSFTALPAKKSKKLENQDRNRLSSLSGMKMNIGMSSNIMTSNGMKRLNGTLNSTTVNGATNLNGAKAVKKNAVRLDSSYSQRGKDLALLEKLGGRKSLSNPEESATVVPNSIIQASTSVTLEESKSTALSVIAMLKAKKNAEVLGIDGGKDVRTNGDVRTNIGLRTNIVGETNILNEIKNKETPENKVKSKKAVTKKTQIRETQKEILTEKLPDEKLLDEKLPDKKLPDKKLPDKKVLDKKLPDKKLPDKKLPDKKLPDKKILNKKLPNKEIPNHKTLDKGGPSHELINKPTSTPKPKDILSTCNETTTNRTVDKTDTTNGFALSRKALEEIAFDIPLLSGKLKKTIDLSAPVSRRLVDRAKLNAMKYVQRNGPLKKGDPMNVRGSGQKRLSESLEQTDPKKQKILENEFFSERFKKMMNATSKHMDLLEQRDNEEQEKYFDKLEIKERMEEKMMSTYKIECKAVRCLTCKYTSFSAADRCKTEKHPLKVSDAFKRFFKCADCGNRTCCLEIVPLFTCKNCGSSRWEKTTMMKEKKVTGTHSLSIRGGEQTFVNSDVSDGNLNLMVPDNE